MYTLKNDGASRRVVLPGTHSVDLLPRNTQHFRWLICLVVSLIVVRHLMAFDNVIMRPACQAVSYAALGSISMAPVLSFF